MTSLAKAYIGLKMNSAAEQHLTRALEIQTGFEEAEQALAELHRNAPVVQ